MRVLIALLLLAAPLAAEETPYCCTVYGHTCAWTVRTGDCPTGTYPCLDTSCTPASTTPTPTAPPTATPVVTPGATPTATRTPTPSPTPPRTPTAVQTPLEPPLLDLVLPTNGFKVILECQTTQCMGDWSADKALLTGPWRVRVVPQ